MIKNKNLCYVGAVINSKDRLAGYYLDSYYMLKGLRKVANVSIVDILNKDINVIKNLRSSDSIWVEYPVNRIITMKVAIVSVLWRKKLIIRVRDLPVEQAQDLRKQPHSFFHRFQLKFLEKMLFLEASVVILSAPDLLKYLSPRSSRIIVFPPGVSKDELDKPIEHSTKELDKHVLLYAGSLDRGGMIEWISSTFSNIPDWKLWVAGNGKENVHQNKNTKYLGLLTHLEVQRLYTQVDAIIVPYPDKEYYRLCIPLKIGEILATSKPIVTLRLPSLDAYIRIIGLEKNIIYVDKWTKNELEKALKKAKVLYIDPSETKKKLKRIVWEERINNLIREIDEDNSVNYLPSSEKLKWI